MIDTHVHMNVLEPPERDEQLEAARGVGARVFIEVANSAENSLKVAGLANDHDDLYCGVAVHPYRVESYDPSKDNPLLKRLITENSKKMVCVGECGLDYGAVSPQVAEKQRHLFRDMVRLAREFGLPLNLHSERHSAGDLISILREEKGYEVGGIIHNFQGNGELARRFLDLGLYVSAFALIMHPRAERLRGVFRDVPIGQVVIGTDAPVAKLIRTEDSDEPYPHDMDKRCEPRMLRYICDKLAEIKEMPVEEVEAITTLNASRAFGLPGDARPHS